MIEQTQVEELEGLEEFKEFERPNRTTLYQSQMLKKLNYNSWSHFLWVNGSFTHSSETSNPFRQRIVSNKELPENCYTSIYCDWIRTYLKSKHRIFLEAENPPIQNSKTRMKIFTPDHIIWEGSMPVKSHLTESITIALEYLTITNQFTSIK